MGIKERIKNMSMTQYLVTAYVVTGAVVTVALALKGPSVAKDVAKVIK